MTNVIQFPAKPPAAEEPTMTIYIYDNGDDAGFSWVVSTPDPPDKARLQEYLGDMFLTLAERTDRTHMSFGAFLRRLNPFSRRT